MRKLGVTPDVVFKEWMPKMFDKYELRQSQLDFANDVYRALKTGTPLMIEAPTGVGKSFAYIIGALCAGAKVVTATANKKLQEQLYTKDLPFLQALSEANGGTLTFKRVVGKSNYGCLVKAQEPEAGLFAGGALQKLIDWVLEEQDGMPVNSGLNSDVPFQIDWKDWEAVAVDESCMGKAQCPLADKCHMLNARSGLAQADVLILNHHLLAIDLVAGFVGVALPFGFGKDGDERVPQAIIIDEAHEWPGILSDQTSVEVHFGRFRRYADDEQLAPYIQSFLSEWESEIPEIADRDQKPRKVVAEDYESDSGKRLCSALRMWAEEVWAADAQPTTPGEFKLRAQANAARNLAEDVQLVSSCTAQGMVRIVTTMPERKYDVPWQVLVQAIRWDVSQLSGSLAMSARSYRSDVKPEDTWKDEIEFVSALPILTSATLSAGGSMKYLLDQVGLNGVAMTKRLPHVFDYTQSRLYVPLHFKSTDKHSREFQDEAGDLIWDLAQLTNGRMFVLATAYTKLKMLADRVEWHLQALPRAERGDWQILRQDTGYGDLVGSFKAADGHKSILFGTATYWQGVDVPGEALSQVVITGCPFPVFTDPVFKAREQALPPGKTAFMALSLPMMSMQLTQGVGRLIRRGTDRGVVTILDDRISTGRWGSIVLNDLPPFPVVNQWWMVENYFKPKSNEVGDML